MFSGNWGDNLQMIDNIKILDTKILSDNWYVLRRITYEYTKKDGLKVAQSREAYDRGNGATILLYNKAQKNCNPYTAISSSNIYKRK